MKKDRVINYIPLTIWFGWSALTLVSFIDTSLNVTIVTGYLIYFIVGSITLLISKHDLLSPSSVFVLISFTSFFFPLPLFQYGLLPKFLLTEPTLEKIILILNIALLGFILGSSSSLHKAMPINKLLRPKSPDTRPTATQFLILLTVTIGAAYARLHFHLGEAGVQPTVKFAGIIQYFLYDGVLISAIWFLFRSLKFNKKSYIGLAMLILLCIAVTQSYLGWRSGIIQILIVVSVAFWYQLVIAKRKTLPLTWLVALLLVVSSVMQLGNEVRHERLGGQKAYAESSHEWLEKIIFRSQGLTRLSAVVEHVGDLTLLNNYMVIDLYKNNMTTTTYVDRHIYDIEAHQSHSVGTSGPGGPYLGMGLTGVFLSYLALGCFYRSIYNASFSKIDPNLLAASVYAYLITMLFKILSGNFGLNAMKSFIAILAISYLLRSIAISVKAPTINGIK